MMGRGFQRPSVLVGESDVLTQGEKGKRPLVDARLRVGIHLPSAPMREEPPEPCLIVGGVSVREDMASPKT